MICYNCKKEIHLGAKFCNHCGMDIEKSEQEEVKYLYHKLAHKFHPDKTNGNEEMMKKINKAYADGDLETLRTLDQDRSVENIKELVSESRTEHRAEAEAKAETKKEEKSEAKNKQNTNKKSNTQNRIILYVGLCLLVLIVIGSNSSSVVLVITNSGTTNKNILQSDSSAWKIFNSTSDQFSILLPTDPISDVATRTTENGTAYKFNHYTAEKDGEIFVIAKFFYSGGIADVTNPDSFLKVLVNGFVGGIGGTLISSSFTYSNSYRVLDFFAQGKDISYKGRLILVDQTPYVLVMGYSLNKYNETNYKKFIDSFVIKKEVVIGDKETTIPTETPDDACKKAYANSYYIGIITGGKYQCGCLEGYSWNNVDFSKATACIKCSSTQCIWKGQCKSLPANGYCVTGDPVNAWKCNEGYNEVGNSCIKKTPSEACQEKYGSGIYYNGTSCACMDGYVWKDFAGSGCVSTALMNQKCQTEHGVGYYYYGWFLGCQTKQFMQTLN